MNITGRSPGTYALLWREVPYDARATYGRLADQGRTWARSHPRGEPYLGSHWHLTIGHRPEWVWLPEWGGPGRCRAAIEYFESGLYYPCGRRERVAGLCWTHKGGRRGGPRMNDAGWSVKRRTTVEEETVRSGQPAASLDVPLGVVTVGLLPSLLERLERAAKAVNAPSDAAIEFDSFDGESTARLRWPLL